MSSPGQRARVEGLAAGLPPDVVAASEAFAPADPSGPPSGSGYTLDALEAETARRVESGQRARVEGLAAGLPPDVVAASEAFAPADPSGPPSGSGYTLDALEAETARRVESGQRARVEGLAAGLPPDVVAASEAFAPADPSGPPSGSGYTLDALEAETARRVESGQRARVEGLAAGLPPDVVAASEAFAPADPSGPPSGSGYTLDALEVETARRVESAQREASAEDRDQPASDDYPDEWELGLDGSDLPEGWGQPPEVVHVGTAREAAELLAEERAEPEVHRDQPPLDALLDPEAHEDDVRAAAVVLFDTHPGFRRRDWSGLNPESGAQRYTETQEIGDAPAFTIGHVRRQLEWRIVAQAARYAEGRKDAAEEPPELVLERARGKLRELVDEIVDTALGQERLARTHEADAEKRMSPATTPAPEPAVGVTEADQLRLAVHAVMKQLPRTKPHPGNPSYRPPAVSDERFNQMASATHHAFVKKVIAGVQESQQHYSDHARTASEKDYLWPVIAERHQENLAKYEEAEKKRWFFRGRSAEPMWAKAETEVMKNFAVDQLRAIEDVCSNIQRGSPARVRFELQQLEPGRATAPQDKPDRWSTRRSQQRRRGDSKSR